ncbi:hypothetical protein [Mesorhizobium sp. WSM3864]|uniref:hypothetical protein n=1 Tax=Mesorhizobium sp. WSM3864 TaxID=2029404 RepID=UPI001FE07CA4|nr:hypothetical protein [Mesorhizobium sp. WSM3864]
MSRLTIASELEAAADQIAEISRADLQIMLRRAGLMLRNVTGLVSQTWTNPYSDGDGSLESGACQAGAPPPKGLAKTRPNGSSRVCWVKFLKGEEKLRHATLKDFREES